MLGVTETNWAFSRLPLNLVTCFLAKLTVPSSAVSVPMTILKILLLGFFCMCLFHLWVKKKTKKIRDTGNNKIRPPPGGFVFIKRRTSKEIFKIL